MKQGMTWLQEAALRKSVSPHIDVVLPMPVQVEGLREAVERVTAKAETRQAKWKRLHPEKVKEAQKLLMRKRRVK